MMSQNRALRAKALSLMMTLFNQFTVTTPVNYPDGTTVLVTYWTNADAEQRYNDLKKSYDSLHELQKEG
jgi:hypothetical protein